MRILFTDQILVELFFILIYHQSDDSNDQVSVQEEIDIATNNCTEEEDVMNVCAFNVKQILFNII